LAFNILNHLCTFQDADASIRKRALELVFLLVNDTNVKPLTKELVDYLDVADPDFKEDLTAKICSITEKLVPICLLVSVCLMALLTRLHL
jgi:hypothetical protein